MTAPITRIILIILDSVGCGDAPDAAAGMLGQAWQGAGQSFMEKIVQ